MADYKTIHGTTIKSYTTDPDNIIEGQVWYDKTNKVLQFQIPNTTSAGAWRTGGSLNIISESFAVASIVILPDEVEIVTAESPAVISSAAEEIPV